MKRIFYIITALALMLALYGCGVSENKSAEKTETPKLKIVTTIFPEYSWVREILGSQANGAELTMLSKKGIDMHSYQPNAEDILKIANCDLFIYVGGESDKWVDKALQEGSKPGRRVINLMQLLGERVKVEEEVEGMEKDAHHDHDHDKDAHAHDDKDKHDEKHGHEDKDKHEEKHHEGDVHDKGHDKDEKHHHDETEYDEHVWLSLKNAEIACRAIMENLAALDPKNADAYRTNYEAYSKKLAALDKQYAEVVEKAPAKVVLFGDRFPFRYLTDDYGLTYFAAFKGCSAETEASFETVAFLAKKLDELKLPAVLTIEGRQHKLAQTIVDNTAGRDQKILKLHSMQSVTEEDMEKGLTYLSVMADNLKVLQEVLR